MKGIIEVRPVICRPSCLEDGIEQDCFHCEMRHYFLCSSPRSLCIRPYPNHKKGCPNYGKKNGCPPGAPMFDEVYDLSRPVYVIYNVFDFKGHVGRMRRKHPKWSQRQLECCLYWQGTARKQLKTNIAIFHGTVLGITGKDYSITTVPEALGVNVTETMKRVGVELEWPPVNVAYQIAMAGIKEKK